MKNQSPRATLISTFLVIVVMMSLVGVALGLITQAWKSAKIETIATRLPEVVNPNHVLNLLEVQLEQAGKRLAELDPGPPPPWYYPSYYYDWSPRSKLYQEAQQAMELLKKQKEAMIQKGKIQSEAAKSAWNFGIAPILHLLLSLTLLWASVKILLRFALWKGWFEWDVIERGGRSNKNEELGMRN